MKSRHRSQRQRLIVQLDNLFRELVRKREACQIRQTKSCSPFSNLQVCHIVSRRYHFIRWEEENALLGCSSDHLFFTLHPLEWESYIARELGGDYLDHLKQKAMAGEHLVNVPWLEFKVIELKEKLLAEYF